MPGCAPSEKNKYRKTLELKQAQLSAGLRRRDGIEVVPNADALDNQQQAVDRELTIHSLEQHSVLLRNVRAAIRRLDEGAYGVCVNCEEEISPRRLAAVPWTPYCIHCQEKYDRGILEPAAAVAEYA